MSVQFSRRSFVGVATVSAVATSAAAITSSPVRAAATGGSGNVSDGLAGMSSWFPLSRVKLLDGPFLRNQDLNLAYLRFVDEQRLLRNFRVTFGIGTSASAVGGWESPTATLKGHSVGHLMSGLALAYANTGDVGCKAKGDTIVEALAQCQSLATSRGFSQGYLSAYPEQVFKDFERKLPAFSPDAPYYVLHKIMQGLLDQYELAGNSTARSVLVALADWVDRRTAALSPANMQASLETEYGGMPEVLTNVGYITGDSKYYTAAARWYHASVMDELAQGLDPLPGLHANRQIANFPGILRLWEQTRTAKYYDATNNFFKLVLAHYTYAHGGNSEGEFFRERDGIAIRLTDETSENCNTYNMLKIARMLLANDRSRVELLDYYERALFNQMLGEQQPTSAHGFNSYFLGTKPGSIKQEYPRGWQMTPVANGDYSSDYENFTCDHGSGLETQAKFADTIYASDSSGIWVNLFIPSEVDWAAKNLVLRQITSFPNENTTTISVVSGSAATTMRVRVPKWISGPVSVTINGVNRPVSPQPGTWLEISRTWTAGDAMRVTFPMSVGSIAANDIAHVKAVTYGPIVLAGQYGTRAVLPMPRIDLSSVTATGTALQFTAQADGQAVTLMPLAQTHKVHYNEYWLTAPKPAPLRAWYRFDGTSGPSVADSGPQHLDASLPSGDGFSPGRVGNAVVLTGGGGHVRLPAGVIDNLQQFSIASWVRIDSNRAWQRIFDFGAGVERNMYLTTQTSTGKLAFTYMTGVNDGSQIWRMEAPMLSTVGWHHVAVTAGAGVANLWVDGSAVATHSTFDRVPALLGSNLDSNFLGKSQYTADPTFAGALDDFRIYSYALSAAEVGQLWAASFGATADVKMIVKHTGKVLGVAGMSLTDGASAIQWTDTGTDDHLWRLLDQGDGWYKIRNKNSGKVLGVAGMSTSSGGQVLQWSDTGTADHLWQLNPVGSGWFKVKNKNSGLVLTVDSSSTTDGASAVQAADSTGDQKLWRFQ